MTESDVDQRARAALDAPMPRDEEGNLANEAGAATVRQYLSAILAQVVYHDPPRRMWGESDWLHRVHIALVKAELISGTFDEDGYIEEMDTAGADTLLLDAANALGELPEPVNPPPLDHQVDVLAALVQHLRARLEFIEHGADFGQPDVGLVTTPAQDWGWLLTVPFNQRARWLNSVAERVNQGGRCFMRNHEAELESQREEIAALRQRITELGGELR